MNGRTTLISSFLPLLLLGACAPSGSGNMDGSGGNNGSGSGGSSGSGSGGSNGSCNSSKVNPRSFPKSRTPSVLPGSSMLTATISSPFGP